MNVALRWGDDRAEYHDPEPDLFAVAAVRSLNKPLA